ncbi:MAG TPA: HNH endonuclease signature motif containing protein [Phycisphaerae bacterium]|nr:HNH endonuclease signature motif containing protein [Phycisphaerae bacterium]
MVERDGGRCRYCRLAQFGHGATFHIDHIIPRSKGGATHMENLALQCPHCSLRKANRTEATDPQTSDLVPLFSPLLDRWDEHFKLSADATLVGLSSSGRATIAALGLNETIPRFARLCQMTLGLL